MKRTMTNITVSVVLALVCLALFASSAQAIQIRAETGETLPSEIIVDESLTVMITDDVGTAINGSAEGARVRYILPADGGTPIPVDVGADGKTVNPYRPPMTGVLNIAVSYGTTLMASQTVNVVTAETRKLGGVEISPKSADLPIDAIEEFSATCTDMTDVTLTGCDLSWKSSDTAVGTINSSSGHFTALRVGVATVTVTATYGSDTKTDTATVNVYAGTTNTTVTNETVFAVTSGDANVSCNFTSNVSGWVSVTATGNATASSEVNQSNPRYGLGSSDTVVSGVTVNVSDAILDELAAGNGTIRIKICYSETTLTALGIDASTLAIWKYNSTTEKWVQQPSTRSGTCVYADVTHLCTFALAGTTTSSDTHHHGGGGGGSGTYPPGWLETPTPTVTPASSSSTTATTTATAARTAKQAATKKPTVKQTTAAQASSGGATADAPAKKGLPGFEGVFAIAGLLAIAYVMMRQKR